MWQEIQSVITAVDAEKCKSKVSKEKTMKGKLLYSPIDMNAAFNKLLRAKEWHESRVSYWVTRSEKLIRKTLCMTPEEQKKEIEAAGEKPIFSYNQTDFVKDRVAIEVQFGKYAFVAYDLFDGPTLRVVPSRRVSANLMCREARPIKAVRTKG